MAATNIKSNGNYIYRNLLIFNYCIQADDFTNQTQNAPLPKPDYLVLFSRLAVIAEAHFALMPTLQTANIFQ
jgi:hypothetical protein